MRARDTLLLTGLWALAAVAAAQTPVTPTPVAARPRGSQHGVIAASAAAPAATKTARRPAQARTASKPPVAAAKGGAPAGQGSSVLSLGTTDITGNKELPKVMAIVPWKSPSDADGVIKPRDSLLDEALEPVDRAVFQRRIRYYRQLNAPAVAPVGDSH